MGYLVDFSERSSEVRRFEEGLKAAKYGLEEVCAIWENMKQDFSERSGGSYAERYTPGYQPMSYGAGMHYRNAGGATPMMSERDWAELQERRRRDGMGRFY